MMKKTTLLLPVLAWSAPVLATQKVMPDCDAECVELNKIMDDLVDPNYRPPVSDPYTQLPFPLSSITENDLILVEGQALPDAIGESAFAATYADLGTDMRIENALRDVPGLQQFRRSDARSANPTSQGITLRGLGGNASSRALLLLDGVPQADPFGGWVAWAGYDALPIANAKITRGGGSVVSGAGAIAGTINMFSANVGDSIEASAAYGSRDSVEADVVVGRKLGGGQLTISANYARGDGFIPIIESQRGDVDRPAEYEQAGIAIRYVAPLTDNVELQANARAFTDDRERGFAFSENHNDGADASIRLVDRNSDWQWSALGYVQIRNFDVSFGGVSDNRNDVSRVFEQFNVPSTGLGASLEIRPPVGDTVDLRLGGDWRRTEGVTNENFFFADNDIPRRSRRAGGSTATYGAFAEIGVEATEALTLTGGARIDFWNIADGFRREIELIDPFPGAERNNDIFADRSGEEFTARGGVAYQASDSLTLRGAAYTGWRLPTLNELFRPFRVGEDATAANELLEPERVKGGDVGFDYDADFFSFSATAFYNILDNAVANVTLDRGPGLFPGVGFVSGAGTYSQRQNLDRIRAQGVEVDAYFDLESITPGLSFAAGYAYTDAEVRGDGAAAALTGLRPAQIAAHSARAKLQWRHDDGHEMSVTARYVGPQFEDDLNTQILDDALSVDAGLGFAISEKLSVTARAENIFDTRVAASISNSGIVERAFPRTFWIGLRARIE